MKFKRKKRSLEPESPEDPFSAKASEGRFKNESCDEKFLKRVLRNLSKLRRRGRRREELWTELCFPFEELNENVDDEEITLRSRQHVTIMEELRQAVMRQDWDEVTALLIVLCRAGPKMYECIILKVCFILVFSHPNSSDTLVQNFIRNMTDYILEEEVNKFIRILFLLQKSTLTSETCGKYIRSTADCKVTREVEFEEL